MKKIILLCIIFSSFIYSQGIGIPTVRSTIGDSTAVLRARNPIVYVKDFIATNDTTSSWHGAIQAAIDAIKSSVGVRTSNLGYEVGEVVLPAGLLQITSAIKLYSGITLKGQGSSTEIVQKAGFSGEQLIELTGVGNYVDDAKIKDIKLTTTSVRAIGCGSTTLDVVNSIFENITLNATQGIILDEYTQGTIIKNIYSFGAVDTILYLYGNFNYVENIDKEGSTGTSVGAYIYLDDLSGGTGACSGNELHNILIEGSCSANKSGMIIRNAEEIVIKNYWYEADFSDGYMVRVEGCNRIEFSGYYHTPSSIRKIKIDSTRLVTMNEFSTDGENNPLTLFIEKDSTSTIKFKNLELRGYHNPYVISELNKNTIMDRAFNKSIWQDNAAGTRPNTKLNFMSASNLLINPSFEAGIYGWTTTADTTAFSASEVNKGLMLRSVYNDTSNGAVYQNIVIPSSMVGQTLTFSALTKATSGYDGNGWMYPYLEGCGITPTNGYNRVYIDSGWQIIIQTIKIQTAGTLTVGIGFINILEYYADDCNLSIGTDAILNSNKFGDITLDSNTIVYASASPTTGTWRRGDIVFNDGVSTNAGWMCTAAGAPGTWATFGEDVATDFLTGDSLASIGRSIIPSAPTLYNLGSLNNYWTEYYGLHFNTYANGYMRSSEADVAFYFDLGNVAFRNGLNGANGGSVQFTGTIDVDGTANFDGLTTFATGLSNGRLPTPNHANKSLDSIYTRIGKADTLNYGFSIADVADGSYSGAIFTTMPITVTFVRAVLRTTVDGVQDTAKCNIYFSTDISSGSPNALWSTDKNVIDSTTGTTYSSFDDATIPAYSWIWLQCNDEVGTVNQLNMTVFARKD